MDDHSSPKGPMTGAEMSAAQSDDAQTRSGLAGGAQTGGAGTGDSERGGGRDARGRGGNGRGGRVNTSAWLIGILVVLVAVFAGLRYAGRTPTPSRPAPTRPAPTRPAPSVPTPTPTAPAPTVADLKRDLTNTESAISRRDWTAANTHAASLRARWQSLRSRVRSTDTTRDVTAFDSRLQKLTDSIKARNEAGARADVAELKSLADRLEVAPTRSSTAG